MFVFVTFFFFCFSISWRSVSLIFYTSISEQLEEVLEERLDTWRMIQADATNVKMHFHGQVKNVQFRE